MSSSLFIFINLAAIIFVTAVAIAAENDLFVRVDPIAFQETDFKVSHGMLDLELEYEMFDLCDIIKKLADSKDEVTRVSYEVFFDQCEKARDKYFDPAFKELISAMNPESLRYKREPVTLAVLGVISIVTAIATGISTTNYYLSDDSPYNTVPVLQQQLIEMRKNYTAVEQSIDAAKNVSHIIQQALGEIDGRISKNRNDLLTVSKNSAHQAWQASDMYSQISTSSRLLLDIAEDFRKGVVNMRAIGLLMDNRVIASLDSKNSRWMPGSGLTESMHGRPAFKFEIRTPVLSKDTVVLKTVPFNTTMINTPDGFRVSKYSGSEYIMYNRTSNCTMRVDLPIVGNLLHEYCITENHADPSFHDWTPTDQSTLSPSIRIINGFFQLNCYGSNFQIRNQTFVCPPWPIQMKRDVEFTFLNKSYSYEDIKLRYEQAERNVLLPISSVNSSAAIDNEFILTQGFLKQIATQNAQWRSINYTGDAFNVTVTKSGWNLLPDIPSFLTHPGLILVVSFGLIACCLCLVRIGGNGSNGSPVHVEVINNNGPSPTAPPEPLDGLSRPTREAMSVYYLLRTMIMFMSHASRASPRESPYEMAWKPSAV